MNENKVLQQSFYVFLIGCILFSILSFVISNISYVIGFILGYIINVGVFLLIIKMSSEILTMKSSSILIAMGFILKLLMYSLGFYLAVKLSWINIISVFFGYLITKITIYIGGYIYKGGEGRG